MITIVVYVLYNQGCSYDPVCRYYTADSDLAFDKILGNASRYDDKILEKTKFASKYTTTFQSKTATGYKSGGRYSLADLDRGGGFSR